MIWVILCKDKPNSFKKRMDVIDEHRKYLSSTLLGNARKGRPSSIYFRSLQLGRGTEY